MQPLILFAASEMYPFSKTGGLGDVLGALPYALHQMGLRTAVVTPFYGRLQTSDYGIRLTMSDVHVGYPWAPTTADVYEADFHGMPVYFISRGEYFDRRFFYADYKGDYFDNCERFVFFCRAVTSMCRRLGEAPAIVHCHDWQSALLPALLYYWRQYDAFWHHTRTVMTIHNLAFQGRFASRLFENCSLPPQAWSMDGVEFYGDFNLLKGGIALADKVTTVSPSYSREITTETFGCGLEGMLRKRSHDLQGILNGADYDIWKPDDNRFLPCTYTKGKRAGKKRCKRGLLDELGLDSALEERPLLGFIGRLRDQKGIDLLIENVDRLVARNVGIVILGEGSLEYEARVLQLMEEHKGRLCARVEYTEDLAHRIQAGSDVFLMPSRYEPCGLTQIYALRFGTPPVASAVGGLRDTIKPWPSPDATGFTFTDITPQGFWDAIMQAVSLWENDPRAWNAMVTRAMAASFTWEKASRQYISMYQQLGIDPLGA